MKTLVLIPIKLAAFIVMLGLLNACSKSDTTLEPINNEGEYPFQSAIVIFDISGTTDYAEQRISGTVEVYVDEGGIKEAQYYEKTVHYKDAPFTKSEVWMADGYMMYGVDFAAKQYLELDMSHGFPNGKPHRLSGVGFDVQLLPLQGFQKQGTEKVLGKTCEVWNRNGETYWLWGGFILKEQHVSPLPQGIVTMEAVGIQLDVAIPAEKVTVPSDFTKM